MNDEIRAIFEKEIGHEFQYGGALKESFFETFNKGWQAATADTAESVEIRDALQALVTDLEERSLWSNGSQKGIVACGNGVYTRAKQVLAKHTDNGGGVTEPVSVSLNTAAQAIARTTMCVGRFDFVEQRRIAKAVLDAAGLSYVD